MKKSRKKIGLALGSGSVRGLAHIGVIKKLVEHHIPIDYIAGSSMGAWIGAHFALYQDIKKLEEYTIGKKKEKVFSFLEPTFFGGLIKGDKVEKLLNTWLSNSNFSDTAIPLAVVATDLVSGECIPLRKGNIAKAVRASMSVPTLFAPVPYNGKLLVDGAISNPVPDDIVRELGADIVISVNLDNWIKNESFLLETGRSVSSTTERSINIMRHHLSRYATSCSDFIIEPYTPASGITGLSNYFNENITIDLVRNGEKETEKIIRKIQRKLLA